MAEDEVDYAHSRTTKAWRRAVVTGRIVRRGWPGFAYQASANAVGALTALIVGYLVAVAGGLVRAVPVAVILSFAGLALILVGL